MAFTNGRSGVAGDDQHGQQHALGQHVAPVQLPTAAEHHRVAAVFRPRTFMPSFMITPAPRKPTPETT